LKRLRHQLILSHLVPYLIVIPVLGVALVYLLESQIVLADAASKLSGQGVLIAEILYNSPGLWDNKALAQAEAERVAAKTHATVRLYDPQYNLLASSETQTPLPSSSSDLPSLDTLVADGSKVDIVYSLDRHAEVIDVYLPIAAANQEVKGVIQLSQRLQDIYQNIVHVRSIVFLILGAGLFLTISLGLVLSGYIERPLRRVTEALSTVVSTGQSSPISIHGPLEIRWLQEAFNLLIERLNELENSRRLLISNLVHELGRSFGALRAAIQALLGGGIQNPELQRTLLSGMDGEIKQMDRHLGDLSNLQEILTSSLELDVREIALSEYLHTTLRPWEIMAREKGLQWAETIPSSMPIVKVDPQRLGQALGNILGNAIKFTPAHGIITVSTSVKEDSVWIMIRDSGAGIPGDELTRIFQPFYQSQSGESHSSSGMGLGLSIAQEIIRSHGGMIEVQSTPGEGSLFRIRLPR
jgi:signal transduction histidine kinase